MPRKTINSLEAVIEELHEQRERDRRARGDLINSLSDTQQRLKESQMRQAELVQDKLYLQKLCSELSMAIRTRS